MGGYNISINDAYAAAATGLPVQPGLAYGMGYLPPYAMAPNADIYHKSHGSHGHHNEGHKGGFWQKAILFGSGIALLGGLLALSRGYKGPIGQISKRRSIINPLSWKWGGLKPGGRKAAENVMAGNRAGIHRNSQVMLRPGEATSFKTYPYGGGRLNPVNWGKGSIIHYGPRAQRLHGIRPESNIRNTYY